MTGILCRRLAAGLLFSLALVGGGLAAGPPAPKPSPPAPAAPAGPQAARDTAAPPRSIQDVLSQLATTPLEDPHRHDAERKLADTSPPAGADAKTLIGFYLKRARAAADLGRSRQHIDDAAKALELAEPIDDPLLVAIYAELAAAESDGASAGSETATQEHALALAEKRDTPAVIGLRCVLAKRQAEAGNFAEAEHNLTLAGDAAERFGAMPENADRREAYRAQIAEGRAVFLIAQGKPRLAEPVIRAAIADTRTMQGRLAEKDKANEAATRMLAVQESRMRGTLVMTLRAEGKLVEAEAEARRLLADAFANFGRGSTVQQYRLLALAGVLTDEGRLAEAEALFRSAATTAVASGAAPRSRIVLDAQTALAAILASEGKYAESEAQFAAIDKAIGDDTALRARFIGGHPRRIVALLGLHRAAQALPEAEVRVAASQRRYGEKSYRAAMALGLRGAVLAQLGRRDAAGADFAAALPRLVRAARNQKSDDGMLTSSELLRRTIFEAAIAFYAVADDKREGATRAFFYADVARGLFVQASLQAAALRGAAGDPALAELVRRDQDLGLERAALRDIVARDAGDRSADITKLQQQVAGLDDAEQTLHAEIKQRFPAFDKLIEPQPAAARQARAALHPGEALVAFYVAEDKLYAWALRGDRPVAFAATAVKAAELAGMVAALRRSLDSDAATVGDLPPFDVALAHRLYTTLLEPVAAGWKGAKTLVVVPHGALAQLPLGLLVTAPTAQPAEPRGGPLFAGYRTVPFLARDVAVAELPSVAALVTLRELPPGAPSRRAFAGFGDPWFTPQQAVEARGVPAGKEASGDAALDLRGLHRRSAPQTEGIESAGLADLPRLPDTAQEVREVATALQADPKRDLFLGALASEERVRTMKLDDRRIVMFATHGLVPGDLDGLDQPALALSAPGVAGAAGDGLLTVEKILGLKLDADWVVLSACNTAAGNGAGAEAVSGLGRAFFYAGARALLVTNWPVETRSARLLTTTAFKLQAADPTLSRAEAVRRAMLGLIDGPGLRDGSGFTVSYAHPIFWAPFSLIGDGG